MDDAGSTRESDSADDHPQAQSGGSGATDESGAPGRERSADGEMVKHLSALLARIREQRPLIHHITNDVVMRDTANITLAIGALPVMALAPEEVEEMVDRAAALVINLGTLTSQRLQAMLLAGKRANMRGIPVILDPVGAGATTWRTQAAREILREVRVAALRGNAAEVGALIGVAGETRGVESISVSDTPIAIALRSSELFGCAVAITGAVDLVADRGGRSGDERVAWIANGDRLLTQVTGSGCMATALIGAFLAVEPDPWLAQVAGLLAMGIAGEIAAERARAQHPIGGPGIFLALLFDAVAQLTADDYKRQRVMVRHA